ncbi:MAG: hypothetical protein REH83_02810 [Rickettsiella sp.]|nr:hypothetical protein [Rickettsiella sp.]
MEDIKLIVIKLMWGFQQGETISPLQNKKPDEKTLIQEWDIINNEHLAM